MTQRTRKLVGTMLVLVVLVAWAIAGMLIYVTFLQGQPAPLLVGYFAVAGIAWMFPAMWIIRWMARPDEPSGP